MFFFLELTLSGMQSPRPSAESEDSSSESEDASRSGARTSSPLTVPSTVPRTFRTDSSGIEPGWSVSSSNTRKSISAFFESPLEKGSLNDLFENPEPYSAQRKGDKGNSDAAGFDGRQ